ncbi:MAG: hypothetical protein GY820_14365, partial [Gammaproteobacteria bacterium]|nr:hypothetical protein [Gammaproteobacteria bacterium]
VADQDRFSEALQLMEQRQDAVENLLRNGGDEQNNSLHNASVLRMVQREEGDEASSDEENNRQSRQNFLGAKDSLKKTRSRKPSSSQDVRFKPMDEGQMKSGRVFRNSALDHSPEIQPILKRPPVSTNQHRSNQTEPRGHTSTPMQNHPGQGNGQNFQNHGHNTQQNQGQNFRPPNGQSQHQIGQ